MWTSKHLRALMYFFFIFFLSPRLSSDMGLSQNLLNWTCDHCITVLKLPLVLEETQRTFFHLTFLTLSKISMESLCSSPEWPFYLENSLYFVY